MRGLESSFLIEEMILFFYKYKNLENTPFFSKLLL